MGLILMLLLIIKTTVTN